MHIKLILPTIYDENGKLVKVKTGTVPNLTIYYLASMVPKPHTVAVQEESTTPIDFDERVDLVGLTVNSINAEWAYVIAREFRSRGVPVVLGGIHVSCLPDEAAGHADAIVIGEAETSWPRLIRDFAEGRMEKVYRDPRPSSLEDLPQPRFDLIDPKKYVRLSSKKTSIIPIQTSRGCPFDCDFCSVTHYMGSKMRYRPIEDVIKEIKRSKAEIVFFADDNFFANPARTEKLCKALIPLKVEYFCQLDTSVYRRPELVKLAKRSGCVLSFIGFESISPKNLKTVNKTHNKPEDYEKLFTLFNKVGINVYASIIFGFDEDDPGLVDETVRFLIRQKATLAAFFPLCPFPGTRLYERLKQQNRLTDNEWWLRKSRYPGCREQIKYGRNQHSGIELVEGAMRKFYALSSILQRVVFAGRHQLKLVPINLIIRSRVAKSVMSHM